MLNEDTTLAECIHTISGAGHHHGHHTIASILTALGFIVSTIVLAIQKTRPRQGGQSPAPGPSSRSADIVDWVKKQLKTLAGWLKALAGKVAAALPGVIAAVVSWLAEHLWALAGALVVAAAV